MNKKFLKKLIASRPDIKSHHGTPMTRRDLFAQGYIMTGVSVATPSLLSLVSGAAHGQDCRAVATGVEESTPVLIIDAAGGWGIAGTGAMVGGVGGQEDFLPSGSYQTLGMMPLSEPSQAGVSLATDFGLRFHPDSFFYQGLASQAATAAPNVDGRVYCVRSGDDQRNNPLNPAYWLRAAGADGQVVSMIGNDDANEMWMGNSMGPANSYNAPYKPVNVRAPGDAVGLVIPGIFATVGGDQFINKIMNATKTMSEAKIKEFSKLSLDEQFNLACAYSNANFQAQSFSSADVDPERDADIAAAFNGGTANAQGLFNIQGTGNVTNTNMRSAAAMTKLLLDGYVGVATLRIGGRDYHNTATWDVRDEELGNITGRCIEAARLKGKRLQIIHITDGSVSRGDNTTFNKVFDPQNRAGEGFFGPLNDSGTRSSIFTLVYNPTAKPVITDGKRQAGAFNAAGAVDNISVISDSPARAAELIVADYLLMKGVERGQLSAELDKVTGGHTLGDELLNLVGFEKLA